MNVSVVIPAYNGAVWIAETLQAILAQTHPAREVIVVDDGSTDDTSAVVARFVPHVTLIQQSNEGVQAARNRGIAAAKGDWIALCDQDDLWLPGYLQAGADLLAADPAIEFIFSNFRQLHNDGPAPTTKFDQAPLGWWDALPYRDIPEGRVFDGSIAGSTFVFHPIFPAATLIAKSLITRVGGFDIRMRGLRNEDGEFMLRCLYHGHTAAILSPLVHIRRHGGNFSADLVRRLQDEVESLQFIRANHAPARQYWPIIDAVIAERRVDAIDAAFASRDHVTSRRLIAALPADARTGKLRLKGAIAALPDWLGHPLNVLLQRAVSGRVAAKGPVLR